MRLACNSGEIDVTPGMRFLDEGIEWEVVAFTDGWNYSPSGIGGTPTILCKPLSPPLGRVKQYMNADGQVEFCGDSVAAKIMSTADAKPRSARGDILTKSARR